MKIKTKIEFGIHTYNDSVTLSKQLILDLIINFLNPLDKKSKTIQREIFRSKNEKTFNDEVMIFLTNNKKIENEIISMLKKFFNQKKQQKIKEDDRQKIDEIIKELNYKEFEVEIDDEYIY